MKTIKIISLFICSLVFISEAIAQTYYYNTTQIFGTNYKCDVVEGAGEVTLYNKSNQYTYADCCFFKTDGTRLLTLPEGETDVVVENPSMEAKAMSIVNNSFTSIEKQRLVNDKLFISLTIDPVTGKVIEVDFNFLTDSGFATFPYTKYSVMSDSFKNQISFTMTSTGKKLKYVKKFWLHKVE